MKTVTVREFYHTAGLVDGLAEGRQLLVTANGRPKFIVSKGAAPRMTRRVAEARAIGNPKGLTFDGTKFLASLKN